MELLEQMVTLGLIFEEPPGCFQSRNTILHSCHLCTKAPISPQVFLANTFFFFLIIAVLMGVKSGVSWWF